MLLELDPSPSYLFPVTIPVRTADGVRREVAVRLRFKRLDQDELAELFDRYQAAIDPTLRKRLDEAAAQGTLEEVEGEIEQELSGTAAMRPVDAMRQELRKVVVGWEKKDFAGEVEFDESNLEKLLRLPSAAACIFYAFGNSIPIAEAKNSKRSPSHGPG